MELEELKSLWKKQTADFPLKGEDEIAAMLKGTSKSIVAKLKRNVWAELIITLIAGLALVLYALILPPGMVKWIMVSIPLIFVAYTVYYIKKLILLNQFTHAGGNIRSNIEGLIANLYDYLHYYRRSYTILYPVYFCLGIIFRMIEKGTSDTLHALSQPRTIAILLFVAILFYFCSTWLVNWLLGKLYGNHLKKLESLLNDIHDKTSI